AVSGPIALRRRIRTASTDLDRRQRTSPGACDLQTQKERDHDQDAVQDGPATHQCLPGTRAGRRFCNGAVGGLVVVVWAPGAVVVGTGAVVVTAPVALVVVTAPAAVVDVTAPGTAGSVVPPGSVVPGAPATVVGAPATVVAVTAPGGATIEPVAAGFDPFASSAPGWGASASAGAPSSALACSPRTKPLPSAVAGSVRGPLAPGAAPRRLISTNGMASCWPYSRPETSSAKGLSSPESVSRTATLR